MINPEQMRVIDVLRMLFPPAADGYWYSAAGVFVNCCDARLASGRRCTLPPDHPRGIHVAHSNMPLLDGVVIKDNGTPYPIGCEIGAQTIEFDIYLPKWGWPLVGDITVDGGPFLLEYVKDHLSAVYDDLKDIAKFVEEET